MKRQLATEWLIDELKEQKRKSAYGQIGTERTGDYRIALTKAIEFCEQAKQKELDNLEDAFYEGIGSGKYQQEYGKNAKGSMLPQQYIKETYEIDK